jgi:hypothetical protein
VSSRAAAAQFAGDPVRSGQVVGPLIAAGVADDNVLVIGERPDVGFLGRQDFQAEVGRYMELLGLRFSWATVVGSTVDVADNLLDMTGCDPAAILP